MTKWFLNNDEVYPLLIGVADKTRLEKRMKRFDIKEKVL